MSVDGLKSIGKYEIVREIGRGSMAHVYLARDPFALQDVAIKVSSTAAGPSPSIAQRSSDCAVITMR